MLLLHGQNVFALGGEVKTQDYGEITVMYYGDTSLNYKTTEPALRPLYYGDTPLNYKQLSLR